MGEKEEIERRVRNIIHKLTTLDPANVRRIKSLNAALDMFEAGMPMTEVAEKTGFGVVYLRRIAKSRGLMTREQTSNKRLMYFCRAANTQLKTAPCVRRLRDIFALDLYQRGVQVKEIIHTTGIGSETTVTNIARRHGIPLRVPRTKHLPWRV